MKLISLKRILKNTKMSIKKDSINILENLVKMKDRLEIQGKSIINLKLFHVLRLMDWEIFHIEKYLIEVISLSRNRRLKKHCNVSKWKS
jgi:hypothetical protein